ncbi:MAG: HAMP domain-containing sensor histidine kinase [Phycisphaerales bacterium]
MKRPGLTWSAFGAALALVLAVMIFFTVKVLSFERSIAEAQIKAALEENVRVALWRMDSAAALLLASSESKALSGNLQPQQSAEAQTEQRFQQSVQSDLNRQEYQQRAALNDQRKGKTQTPEVWRDIEPVLLDRIRDIFPEASLQPVPEEADPAADPRRLASIPARLVLPASVMPRVDLPWNTPLRVSLVVAWICVLLAAAAVGSLLAATLALSERRGAFASAVTHELRTPLTTIRMYGEMLSGGMVADDASKRQYLDTLVTESDRLGHMVENVLAYARLEKRLSPRQAEAMSAGELVERVLPSLRRRATQSGLAVEVNVPEAVAKTLCRTDPVAVQQILQNLVDNACKFGQTNIRLDAETTERSVVLTVSDGGPGLGGRAASLFTAFGKSKTDPVPGIGLGLYLSRELARQVGGDLRHVPAAKGAVFALELPRSEG